jgi:hypothetical protein
MHPELALVDGSLGSGLVPQMSNPTSTGDRPSSRTGSTTLTSSFMGTTQDDNVCST